MDFQHPHRTLLPANATSCGGVGAKQSWTRRVVDQALSDAFSEVLVSDFYTAYHYYDGPKHYDGPKQRCWAHLLRDIHHLRALYPDDAPLAKWADAVLELYRRARAFTHPQEASRRTAQLALKRRLLALCQPFLDDPSATTSGSAPPAPNRSGWARRKSMRPT